jgi:WhiB family redox-sensing transcriptional regulator
MNSDEIEWLMSPMPPEFEAVLKRPAWHAKAACRGEAVDTFFPNSHEELRDAVAICAGCSVKTECRNYALDDPSLKGIWGGMSGRERIRLRRMAS